MTRHMPLRRAVSLGVPASSFPRVWMTAQVQHREDRNQVRFRGEEHTYGKSRTKARRTSCSTTGNLNGFSRSLAKTELTCASKRKPRPSRSRSYRSAASKISSSASDETSSATFSEQCGGGPAAPRVSQTRGARSSRRAGMPQGARQ